MDEAPKPEQSVNPPPISAADVEAAKGTAWLSYLFILWLIPLLTMKENTFAKFHVKQGIMLTILGVANCVIVWIPVVGWVVPVYMVVMAIMGIVNSLNGKYWTMPIVGKWAADWFKF